MAQNLGRYFKPKNEETKDDDREHQKSTPVQDKEESKVQESPVKKSLISNKVEVKHVPAHVKRKSLTKGQTQLNFKIVRTPNNNTSE